jgi:hypothetical protein
VDLTAAGDGAKIAGVHWEGLVSDSEESDCEYSNKEGYFGKDDLDLPKSEVTEQEDYRTSAIPRNPRAEAKL